MSRWRYVLGLLAVVLALAGREGAAAFHHHAPSEDARSHGHGGHHHHHHRGDDGGHEHHEHGDDDPLCVLCAAVAAARDLPPAPALIGAESAPGWAAPLAHERAPLARALGEARPRGPPVG